MLGRVRQDDTELVTAHAGGYVTGADAVHEEPSEGGQDPVSDLIPVRIVEVGEGPEPYGDVGQRPLEALGGIELALQPVKQVTPVEHLRELVAHGHVLKLHVVDEQAQAGLSLFAAGVDTGESSRRESGERPRDENNGVHDEGAGAEVAEAHGGPAEREERHAHGP